MYNITVYENPFDVMSFTYHLLSISVNLRKNPLRKSKTLERILIPDGYVKANVKSFGSNLSRLGKSNSVQVSNQIHKENEEI